MDIPIVEWRSYTLHEGQRDSLITLFEDAFLESQEAAGARVLGQFRVDSEPQKFIWLRGFSNMNARQEALMNFYNGPIWQQHRVAANATMIDSDDVHLLTAALVEPLPAPRPARGTTHLAPTRFLALVCRPADPTEMETFAHDLRKYIEDSGGDIVGGFSTLDAVNTFPALPVWADDPVHIVLLRFDNGDALRAWHRPLPASLIGRLKGPPQSLLLHPTARSALR